MRKIFVLFTLVMALILTGLPSVSVKAATSITNVPSGYTGTFNLTARTGTGTGWTFGYSSDPRWSSLPTLRIHDTGGRSGRVYLEGRKILSSLRVLL